MAKIIPRTDITKHPDFRVIFASGALASVKGDEGFLKFYIDVVEPKIKAGGKPGEMDVDRITREFQVEIRLTTARFLSLSNLMAAHVKELEKKGILKREKKPSAEAETYRV